MHPPVVPQRILFLRPDAYGDLFLFEPIPRLVRHTWPQTEVGVLIREPYADVIPLIASEGVRWLTTACNPYRRSPGEDPAALAALRDTVRAFAPDCLVAACTEQTWLEAAVASFLPGIRQISLGSGLTDPLVREALDAVLPVDWPAIYPEKILGDLAASEWEKNLRLADALLGENAPRWWPLANVPEEARVRAAHIVADAGLTAGEFVVCAAAGTANVQIKSWPAAHYGQTLAWLEREHGIRALLIGHETEGAQLAEVRAAAHQSGGQPALWTGHDGEMAVVAGLLSMARFYFGNDTGALHLAAALGKPVVPVFGGGHWPRFQPVAQRGVTVVQPLPCFGCGWDCLFVDAPCVRTISPESVRRALGQFLATEGADHTVFEASGLEAGAWALIETATPQLRFLRDDSAARLRQTRETSVLLRASEADRDSRLRQVDELTRQLHGSEAESLARWQQIEELTALLGTSENDRAARRIQITELDGLSQHHEAESLARLRQIEELTALLASSEADRAARLSQIEELTALLLTSEADRAARFVQIQELTAWLKTSQADRAQVDELTVRLKASEADRAARIRINEALTKQMTAGAADHPLPADAAVSLAAGQEVDTTTSFWHTIARPGEPPPVSMDFDRLKDNWQRFGLEDPLWAILTDPGTENNRWDPDQFFQMGRDTVAACLEPILALKRDPPLGRARALDFGCGAGRLTRGLEVFFDEVIGVDVAASMIAKARSLSPADTRCQYVLNERPDLSIFADASFDFVLSFIVLQHMRPEHQTGYLREFLRLLRPGGLCLFQLPDQLMNAAEPYSDGVPVMEMHGQTPAMVAKIIADAGGTILQKEENGWAGEYVRSYHYLVGQA